MTGSVSKGRRTSNLTVDSLNRLSTYARVFRMEILYHLSMTDDRHKNQQVRFEETVFRDRQG